MTAYEETMKNRFTGCLLGGALGDALGWDVEFDSLEEIMERHGSQGILEPVANQAGLYEITDDTQMTLFTAEGILQAWASARHFGPPPDFQRCLHQAYRRWLHTQGEGGGETTGGWLLTIPGLHARRAPGNSCLSALKENRCGTLQDRINDSKGCGGVMRVAPIGLLAVRIIDGEPHDKARFAFELGCIAAAITHGHPSGYLPAGFLAALITLLTLGTALEPAVEELLSLLETSQDADETVAAIRSALELFRDPHVKPGPEAVESLGSGWVGEEALAIAIYCALSAQGDLVKGLQLAVNHSGDSDSTGSITGNLLGASVGMQGLPQTWLEKLECADIIIQMAEDLHAAFKGTQYWLECYLPDFQKVCRSSAVTHLGVLAGSVRKSPIEQQTDIV